MQEAAAISPEDMPARAVESSPAYHEMLGPEGVLAKYQGIEAWLRATPSPALAIKMREAELLFRRIGITFAVYK